MRITLLIPTLFSALLLGACSSKSENFTTDYLLEHDDIRAKVLEDCKANKQSKENCQNANEAESKKKVQNIENRMNQ